MLILLEFLSSVRNTVGRAWYECSRDTIFWAIATCTLPISLCIWYCEHRWHLTMGLLLRLVWSLKLYVFYWPRCSFPEQPSRIQIPLSIIFLREYSDRSWLVRQWPLKYPIFWEVTFSVGMHIDGGLSTIPIQFFKVFYYVGRWCCELRQCDVKSLLRAVSGPNIDGPWWSPCSHPAAPCR